MISSFNYNSFYAILKSPHFFCGEFGKTSLFCGDFGITLKFAHSLLANDFPFEKLVFSDESRFCSVSDKKFRWYRKEDCDEQCFATKEKFSTSIMVFGAIGIDFKSRLIICERSIDALYYREVLSQSNLIDSLDFLCSRIIIACAIK